MRAACCALLVCVLGASAEAQQRRSAAAPPSVCLLQDAGSGTVRAVLDGRTVALTDGREIRLAGIEASETGRTALETIAGGREFIVKRADPGSDRHGRLPAYLFAEGAKESVQHALLSNGHARVSAQAGAGCAASLFEAERTARAASLGLWAQPDYAPRRAADAAALLSDKGRFTLVEGRVASVRESGGTIYVNFSRRWSEDFTVTVPRREERAFVAAGLDLKSLTGRGVRVRGVIEERGGPWIEVTRPEQVEILGRD